MRVSRGVLAIVLLCASASAAEQEFPVRDADHAIAIAEKVCGYRGATALKWDRYWDPEDRVWVLSTGPSICQKLTTHFWRVVVPADGPEPTECLESLYSLICVTQKPN
jgi:hypothetical protein